MVMRFTMMAVYISFFGLALWIGVPFISGSFLAMCQQANVNSMNCNDLAAQIENLASFGATVLPYFFIFVIVAVVYKIIEALDLDYSYKRRRKQKKKREEPQKKETEPDKQEDSNRQPHHDFG